MKIIWAPWRMKYIEESSKHKGHNIKEKDCFICQGLKGNRVKNLILYANSNALVMLNRFPYNNGHLMVAPNRHVGEIEELTTAESDAVFELVQKSVKILKKLMKPDGFNIGANLGRYAGAGLPGHFHIHIVPRWMGDINYLPLLAHTKVISESLQVTYRKLKPYFSRNV
jgi:ATP adenylyltransferase